MSKEESWQRRWVRCGVRTIKRGHGDEWRKFFRRVLPGYARLDDEFDALHALRKEKKITERTALDKLEVAFKKLDDLERGYFEEHHPDEVIDFSPPASA
jgi:hypothetical protein